MLLCKPFQPLPLAYFSFLLAPPPHQNISSLECLIFSILRVYFITCGVLKQYIIRSGYTWQTEWEVDGLCVYVVQSAKKKKKKQMQQYSCKKMKVWEILLQIQLFAQILKIGVILLRLLQIIAKINSDGMCLFHICLFLSSQSFQLMKPEWHYYNHFILVVNKTVFVPLYLSLWKLSTIDYAIKFIYLSVHPLTER